MSGYGIGLSPSREQCVEEAKRILREIHKSELDVSESGFERKCRAAGRDILETIGDGLTLISPDSGDGLFFKIILPAVQAHSPSPQEQRELLAELLRQEPAFRVDPDRLFSPPSTMNGSAVYGA